VQAEDNESRRAATRCIAAFAHLYKCKLPQPPAILNTNMLITIEGWDSVDRKPVKGRLTSVDRGQTQAADLVTVTVGTAAAAAGKSVVVKQNPTLLQKTKPGEVRVGACLWDSAYILSALLEHLVGNGDLELEGARCVELGAGCGLVGLVAARLGASVMLTGGL